ncbi:hypothetical protein ACH5RR_021371 [Cinchona calisaya]|uniref:Uncharacterized protein n=1 Tax=Cinchona calisaya TaxID=153742 RepID=A0ABD2ZJZ9_9GENT
MDYYNAMKPYIFANVFILVDQSLTIGTEDFTMRQGFTKSMRSDIELGDWKNGTKIMWNPDNVDVELKKCQEMDTMQLAVCYSCQGQRKEQQNAKMIGCIGRVYEKDEGSNARSVGECYWNG